MPKPETAAAAYHQGAIDSRWPSLAAARGGGGIGERPAQQKASSPHSAESAAAKAVLPRTPRWRIRT